MRKRKQESASHQEHQIQWLRRRLKRANDEIAVLKSYLIDFLSPRDAEGNILEDGCSMQSVAVRWGEYIKNCNNGNRPSPDDPLHPACNYLACRYWYDDPEHVNCSRVPIYYSHVNEGMTAQEIEEMIGRETKANIVEQRAISELRMKMRNIRIERNKKGEIVNLWE